MSNSFVMQIPVLTRFEGSEIVLLELVNGALKSSGDFSDSVLTGSTAFPVGREANSSL
jgi:hypothetical protein